MKYSEGKLQPLKSGSSLLRSFRAAAPQGPKISGLLVSRPAVVELVPVQRPHLSFGATWCFARRSSLPGAFFFLGGRPPLCHRCCCRRRSRRLSRRLSRRCSRCRFRHLSRHRRRRHTIYHISTISSLWVSGLRFSSPLDSCSMPSSAVGSVGNDKGAVYCFLFIPPSVAWAAGLSRWVTPP